MNFKNIISFILFYYILPISRYITKLTSENVSCLRRKRKSPNNYRSSNLKILSLALCETRVGGGGYNHGNPLVSI